MKPSGILDATVEVERNDRENPRVSIVVVTHNRRDDVLMAIESCLSQDYEPLEVLLYDDASTDGTSQAVRAAFPKVRLSTSPDQVGYLVWRNRGFRDARGEFVVSIDDDSYFTDPQTITRLVCFFERYPHAAAVAMPYVEPQSVRSNRRMRPQQAGSQLRSYIGCAHALRRELVVETGGYREYLTHQGEERDLCIRLLEHGWQVIYGDTPQLVHLYSVNRDRERVSYYGYRNTLLFSGLNVPHPYVIPRMVIDSLQLLRYRFSLETMPAKVRAIAAGWIACWRFRNKRSPVSLSTYRSYRNLPSHGPVDYQRQTMPAALQRDPSDTCQKS